MISSAHAFAVLCIALVASHATSACSRTDGAVAGAEPQASASSSLASKRTSSCDRVTGQSVCSEYSGAYLAQNEAVLSSSCAKLSGAFASAECPNTSVLGSCTLATGEVRRFYSSGGAPYDVTRAEAECTGPYKGTWAAIR